MMLQGELPPCQFHCVMEEVMEWFRINTGKFWRGSKSVWVQKSHVQDLLQWTRTLHNTRRNGYCLQNLYVYKCIREYVILILLLEWSNSLIDMLHPTLSSQFLSINPARIHLLFTMVFIYLHSMVIDKSYNIIMQNWIRH
ncbi:unnamed protein product [Musa acuminata subsp. malaccensis]|uniref:(wild Malaysian banana) hypothetical protein n=1 Tax=Musa acuminata subsp. malaccensis TaxID=214687 RepID=A0A804ITM8_MUSAM|nr:unnamed protein product [Musa acuminata subsp. malaccensis]